MKIILVIQYKKFRILEIDVKNHLMTLYLSKGIQGKIINIVILMNILYIAKEIASLKTEKENT